MSSPKRLRFKGVLILFSLVVCMAGQASAAEYWLWADSTDKTMPDGRAVPVWGFGLDGDGNFATAGDYTITVPGPTLRIASGDTTLIIHLKNNLNEPVSLTILGQILSNNTGPVWTNFPDDTQTWSGSRPTTPPFNLTARVRSFSHETAPGAVGEYRWESFRPGTFLLQSGTNPAKQVQMGLFLPVIKDTAPGLAYPGVHYNKEMIVLFHEIDPAIQEAIAAGTYGAVPGATITSSIHRVAKYFLINGMSFPDTGLNPLNGSMPVYTGSRLLIRFLNAGLNTHVPQLLGTYMTLWAEDGNRYHYPRQLCGFELAAGKTADVILEPGKKGKIPLHDAMLNLTNAGQSPGGMLAYVSVIPPAYLPAILYLLLLP
jgi:FtsP/CotA-like multicopper oxidase with cupredoxin domain